MADRNEALAGLLTKYAVDPQPGVLEMPLQHWRCNRRYSELYKLVKGRTIEDVCLLRFSHMTDGKVSLSDTLYREFDLCEYIGQGSIVSLNAVFTNEKSGNVIVKLDNGVIGSVEVGALLPDGKADLERHEIVARRGVANDLPMDVQIPLQSIYTYTDEGESGYRDVDFELYGCSEDEISEIRAAFEYCKDPSSKEFHLAQDCHLKTVVDASFKSNMEHKKIEL